MAEDIHKVGQESTRSAKKSADTVKVASFSNRGKGKERSARKELVAAVGKLQDQLSKKDWLKQGLIEQFNVPAADADKLASKAETALVEIVREFRISQLVPPRAKYQPRTDIVGFLREHWGDWLELDALTRPLLKRHDVKAYNALHHYLKTSSLPDGMVIPDRATLLAMDVADEAKVKEGARIAQVARRLRQPNPSLSSSD